MKRGSWLSGSMHCTGARTVELLQHCSWAVWD